MSKVAIIGGTGLESPKYLSRIKELKIKTPFGDSASVLYEGLFSGLDVIHVVRYGKDHSIPSTKVNYKANFYALKELECEYIIATTTCGSLQEEICPGEFIILDQFIDMTKQRISSIFEEYKPGEVRYTPMAEPFSEDIRDHLIEAAIVQGITVHTKGTVITIEGPRFSTRAESNLFRTWGADIINMTTAPEVILANELGMSYACVALCTEYDSWRTSTNSPTASEIMDLISGNTDKLLKMLTFALNKIKESRPPE